MGGALATLTLRGCLAGKLFGVGGCHRVPAPPAPIHLSWADVVNLCSLLACLLLRLLVLLLLCRLPLPLRIEAQEVLIVDGLVRQASPLKRFGPRSLMKAS